MAQSGTHTGRLALVLSGGGARGAYEAGVIHFIRTQLTPAQGGERSFRIQCGSSVGAINTCFMAAHAHNPPLQGKKIYEVWKHLKQEDIYRRNIAALGSFLGRTTMSLTGNILNLRHKDPSSHRPELSHFRGLLDTEPMSKFLDSIIPFRQINKNLANDILDAVSVTATNVSTGRMELFIQKRPNVKYTGEYPHSLTTLVASHVRASAAIPLIFQPIKIKNTFYIDGGLKLNTPMSPAIQLGATKILLIGSHHAYQPGEKLLFTTVPGAVPSLGQLVGQIMNALFLNRLQYDLEQLNRINRLIEWSEEVYGPDYLDQINSMLRTQSIRGDIANRGLKKIQILSIFPSRDISELFTECYTEDKGGAFSTFEKLLLRMLDVDPQAGVDIMSYLAFIPHYLERLLELGYHDAAAHRDQLSAFLSDTP